MKCFDCEKESAGFQFGMNGIFLCFECMSKRAGKLKEDPKFQENMKKCCCDSDDVRNIKEGNNENS